MIKKAIKTAAVILAIACLSVATAIEKDDVYAVFNNYAMKKLPIYSVEREDKVISISFDCAWGDEYTHKLLDEMKTYDVKCTFFAVKFWAEKYPDDVKDIIAAGHEIGTHSATHSYMSKLSKSQIDDELDSSCKAISDITGKTVELFRPPYGDYNDALIQTATEHNLFSIQWDVDSLDWKNLSAQQIAYRVISKVGNGSIILCHNNGLHTAESLPLIFAALINKGYKFVKISELIYKNNYRIDNRGRQIGIS